MASKNTICAVPFIEAFADPRGGWRNCCVAAPQIISTPGSTFENWWQGPAMQDFRNKFGADALPTECAGCSIQEKSQGSSFRTAVNKTVDITNLSVKWPSRWNIIFGNVCNLACWTCSEHGSSVIESHKRKLNLLPKNFQSPEDRFEQEWPDLGQNILKSYQHHDVVTLTILGGEPLYNHKVSEFLEYLKDNNLSTRTKLEFHTNATKFNSRIKNLLSLDSWKYICIFLSLDAVGPKAEWLRYGCRWGDIVDNVTQLRQLANYTEVHCTLSLLNIMDLESLQEFCDSQSIPLKVSPISEPSNMTLQYWDGPKDTLLSQVNLDHPVFKEFYQLLGSAPVSGTQQELVQYISRFDTIRRPLKEFDPYLARVLGISS